VTLASTSLVRRRWRPFRAFSRIDANGPPADRLLVVAVVLDQLPLALDLRLVGSVVKERAFAFLVDVIHGAVHQQGVQVLLRRDARALRATATCCP